MSEPLVPTETVSEQTVRVELGDRGYDVVIGPGLLGAAGAAIVGRLNGRCAIVTDENVAARHAGALEASLVAAGRHRGTIVLPPGEGTKSFAALGQLAELLLAMGVERGDLVVALGGGVIGDLAGFAAAILRRGVRFVQVSRSSEMDFVESEWVIRDLVGLSTAIESLLRLHTQ